jgi:hypothetical protein
MPGAARPLVDAGHLRQHDGGGRGEQCCDHSAPPWAIIFVVVAYTAAGHAGEKDDLKMTRPAHFCSVEQRRPD